MSITASQAAILRAARAVPGGARPTPAPQGSQIGMGQISPLVWDEDTQAGYAASYGPFLPRPARTFTQGAFGPFSPILPVPVDEPPPGGQLADPRRFQYTPGYNLPTPPGLDGFKMASFDTLYTLANLYSVARTCIERRKMMVAGLDWDIVPTKEAAKAYQGSHAAMRDFGERRAEAVRFFAAPDPDFDDWGSFQSALLEQVFTYDAASVLIRPKYGKGLHRGVLGSDLDCIGLVDGATIRPLLSLAGGRPRPPAPAFQQFLYGVPRSDIPSMWSGKDIEDAGLKGYEGPVFSTDQLIYRPVVPRVNSPYGFSPVEMALVVIMTGLQKQAYQLNYYNEGTVPAVYLSVKDPTMTPAQIRELQGALNAFAGDQAWHHKIIVTPDAAISPQRPAALADQFDEIIMASVAMVFDVDPMSLGIIPNVATSVSPFAAKEMAQASRTVHERTSTKPLLKYLCGIANTLLHRVLSQDDMKFVYSGMNEAQDQAAQTDMLVKQVQSGLISIDEAREELQRTAWGLDETSGPLVFTQMGPVPLNQVIDLMRQQQPVQGGAGNRPAYSGNAVTASHQPRAVHHPPSSRPAGTHNPRAGLPAGPGGAGMPAPRAGSAADTPAHTAARAHEGAGKARAVTAELEALARHVRKGRHITTWVPEHIPGVVMASLAEDLTKGIGVDEAVRGALTVALGPDAYEWADKAAAQTPAQQRAQALARQYTAQVQAAFTQAAKAAVPLIAGFLAGTLAVTAAGLAAMITALAAKYVGDVLRALWAAAWELGHAEAAARAGQDVPDDGQEMAAWIASHGRDWLEEITSTREGMVAAGLDGAARSGQDAETIAGRLPGWWDAVSRAGLIAVTETWRAVNAAVMAVARKLGAAEKSWQTRGDADVCAACKAKQAEGWVPVTQPYQDGLMEPPGHPRCRCRLRLRVGVPPVRKGAARRYVDLPGQEWWAPAQWSPDGPGPGGGGPMHTAHDADGIQQYVPGGVPGMTAGREPPRWDGSEPDALVAASEGAVDAGRGDVQTRGGGTVGGPYADFSGHTSTQPADGGDDAAWPGERGPAPVPPRSWPQQGYMGGYWPSGGHGTTQPPAASIGGGPRGRAPGAAGKAAVPPLKDARPAAADVVYRQMLANYPAASIAWIKDPAITWYGPCEVPLDEVDVHDEDSWAAHHQPGAVDRFAREIRSGTGHTDPVVMVRVPGQKARIIDGHHRYLACWRLGWPCKSYIGYTPRLTLAMEETHSSQIHQGSSPLNKSSSDDPSRVAFLLIRARNEDGKWRYLLQKRADHSSHGGTWGIPGGSCHAGEDPWAAAIRETTEEMGELPGALASSATFTRDGDGKTAWTFLVELPGIFGPAVDGATPDETAGWGWFRRKDVDDLPLHPAFRETWDSIDWDDPRDSAEKGASTSAEILREYWTHEGHPGPTQYALEQKIRWGEPDDWYRCVAEVTPYLGDGAKGYCNLRHKEVLGYWPAQHAQMDGE